MNRAEKIAFLKGLQSQTPSALATLEKLREEAESQLPSEGVILSAYYLLEHGRQSNRYEFSTDGITSLDHVKEVKNVANIYGKTGSYQDASAEGLHYLLEAIDVYRSLKDQNKLHLLDKYRSRL